MLADDPGSELGAVLEANREARFARSLVRMKPSEKTTVPRAMSLSSPRIWTVDSFALATTALKGESTRGWDEIWAEACGGHGQNECYSEGSNGHRSRLRKRACRGERIVVLILAGEIPPRLDLINSFSQTSRTKS